MKAAEDYPGLLPEYADGFGLKLLDALQPTDPVRDDICKRLSEADRVTLMARYGRDLLGHELLQRK